MSSTERWPGRLALMVAHCAGMVDLVALPVWVGVLIARYGLEPRQAGGLCTLFLLGVVVSSAVCAPRVQRLPGRRFAAAGFALAAVAFALVPVVDTYGARAVLHALAGLSTGAALSVTHGTIGRSRLPQRLFAIVSTALGVFAILYLGLVPGLVAAAGPDMLFRVFAGIMVVAALACGLAFPTDPAAEGGADVPSGKATPLGAAVWSTILGITLMALVQAMTFSFVERIGTDRGYGLQAVTAVLITLGIVNLTPAPLAALMEKRWNARVVLLVGPVLQAGLALLLTGAGSLATYAFGTVLFTAVLIFTHTFAFGLLARLDRSGRAVAATPAMVMTGSAIGPLLGGTLVQAYGYETLGLAAAVIDIVAIAFFLRMRAARRPLSRPEAEPAHLSSQDLL